jgi:hypothetical protein
MITNNTFQETILMFLLKKPVKIRAYTYDPGIFEFAKPFYRGENPSWLKNLAPVIRIKNPKTEIDSVIPTVAYCPGIRDFIKAPITIPAWYDCGVRINPDRTWFMDPVDSIGEHVMEHPSFQIGDEFITDRIFIKLSTPWAFRCDEDVNFMYMPAFYNSTFYTQNDIISPPGILNFKHQASTNVHLSFKVKPQSYNVDIKLGTPLTTIFPMTERDIDFKCELLSREEFSDLPNSKFPKVLFGKYYKKLSLLKKK